ncbi:MAG: hypothetical protein V1904_05305 [Bacteroidota bacterium]
MLLLIFTMLGLMYSACNKSEDLLTEDATTGGLVFPTKSVAYKLGGTPQFDIEITIPMGPGITTIEVYNQYFRLADTAESNQALMKTVDVASANASADAEKTLTLTYTDLINGLLVEGSPLPSDEALLPIGDYWLFSYKCVLEDGRTVENSQTTKVDVANRWAAEYLLSGYILREGDPVLTGYYSDIPWKLMTYGANAVQFDQIHLWGDGASTVGGIGKWIITIDDSGGPDNPMPITVTDLDNGAVQNNPAYNNRYEPSTKTFYYSVFWGTGPTNRAATDTLVYYGPL